MDNQEFEALNPEEQAKVFHHSSFKERAELIRHSHDPLALTRSLSHEELYLLTREMDLEDRSEVIRYATMPQLFFIADVDCWKKDRIDSDNFVEWMETLLAAGDEVLLEWLLKMDYETVVAGFQKAVEVLKPEREYAADEILGDTPYFTLDDMYYIAVREENLETVRRAIELLFENSKGRYVSLLEDVLSDIPDEVEETAYQNREIRLSQRGFPDEESARQIYRPMTRAEFDAFPLKNKKASENPEGRAPRYPVIWSADRLFLDEVLLGISKEKTELLEGLHDELAWISNKVIACAGIDFSSEEKVRKGIERARYLVSIGLEELSGRDTAKARKLLEERWCEVIFRWGATSILKLRDRMNKVLRDYWGDDKMRLLNFLMPPYQIVAQGLLRTFPQCYDAAAGEGAFPLRDFKALLDVERTEKSVLQLEKIHRTLKRDFPEIWKLPEEIPGLSALGTLFANFVLKEKPSLTPVPVEKVPAFIEGMKLKETRQKFIEAVCAPEEKEELNIFWSVVFDAIEDELGRLDTSQPLDPNYLSWALILKVKPEAEKAPKGKSKSWKNPKTRN